MSTTMQNETVTQERPVQSTTAKGAEKQSATPKLVCNVTGIGRYTNEKYLNEKAQTLSCTVEEFLNNYVSKSVAKMLREGKTVSEIQNNLGVTYNSPLQNVPEESILRYNGKQKKK
jgi:hypothetical protein